MRLLPVCNLKEHASNGALFGDDDPAEFAKLVQSIDEQGIAHPLYVAGAGCASPEGTVLCGHRRARAARELKLEEVPAYVLEGQSALDEFVLLLGDNRAVSTARKLTEEQQFNIEDKFRRLCSEGSAAVAGVPRGESAHIIAKLLGTKSNAVKDRKKIFESPLATPALKDGIVSGTLTRSTAAAIVRNAEKGSSPNTRTEELLVKVNADVEAAIKKEPKPRAKKSSASSKSIAKSVGFQPTTGPAPDVLSLDDHANRVRAAFHSVNKALELYGAALGAPAPHVPLTLEIFRKVPEMREVVRLWSLLLEKHPWHAVIAEARGLLDAFLRECDLPGVLKAAADEKT